MVTKDVSTLTYRLLNSATYGNLKRIINVSIVSMVWYVATASLAESIEKKILSSKRDYRVVAILNKRPGTG